MSFYYKWIYFAVLSRSFDYKHDICLAVLLVYVKTKKLKPNSPTFLLQIVDNVKQNSIDLNILWFILIKKTFKCKNVIKNCMTIHSNTWVHTSIYTQYSEPYTCSYNKQLAQVESLNIFFFLNWSSDAFEVC